ncbi:MAG TPA: hypothetical protein VM597_40885 [Gemmataceae bacterium]|jgi:hypothetical protein|nr:hypothetical protein [Gemmataceae bacterium]
MADDMSKLAVVDRSFILDSAKFARVNREMRARRTPPAPGPRQPAVSGPGPRSYSAYRWVAGRLVQDSITEWPAAADFTKAATPWEMKRSRLIRNVAERFEPVVLQLQGQLEELALVVAHRGWVNSRRLIAPSGVPHDAPGVPIFVTEDDRESMVPPGWTIIGYSDRSNEVLTTVDGQVLAFLASRTRGVEAMDVSPLDLILAARLVVGLGVAAMSRTVQVLARKEAAQVARTTFAGPTRQLAAAVTTSAEAAGPSFGGLKLGVGYDARMGIPAEHLPKMVEAAKATNVVAVFRANKANAIELIRKGAHGKPMWAKFKSDPDTGVLTAKSWPEAATVHMNGFYTVAENGKTMVRMVNGVRKEAPLPKDPFWPVKPGQVIHPDGKPVVGDYDLLGVIPIEAPGRNIVLVPRDPFKGDWIGPDVAKYKDAVNNLLDKPRVLHGAQDGFHNPIFGGFTDDVAYAVFPNGNTLVISGKMEQKAFYDAVGRQTAVGSYPRPAPGTPVVDEVAAMRARKGK